MGYFESSFLGSSNQTKMEYAATDRVSSHHGWNNIGKKINRPMSNHNRHPAGIAIYAPFEA